MDSKQQGVVFEWYWDCDTLGVHHPVLPKKKSGKAGPESTQRQQQQQPASRPRHNHRQEEQQKITQTQQSGAGSYNNQAGRDLTINHIDLPPELLQQFNHALNNIRNSADSEKKNILLLLERQEFSKAEAALDALLTERKSSYAQELLEIAELYLPLNKEKSKLCYEQAAQAGQDNPELLNKYAIYLMNTGKLDEAHTVFDLLLAMSHCDDKVRELALGNRGVLYKNQGKWQEAISYLRQAQVLSIRNNNKIIETSNLNNLGACFNHMGELGEADSCLRLALEKIENLLDQPQTDPALAKLKSIQANALSNLSINKKKLFLQSARSAYLDEAEQLLKRAIDINQSSGNKSFLIRHHGNLANIYKLQEQYEKMHRHLEKARVLSISHGTLKDKLTVQVNLAEAYHKEHKHQQALQTYENCFANEKILEFRQLTATALSGLADVHRALDEEPQANHCAAQASALFAELGFSSEVERIRKDFPMSRP
ncbi:MULTISPECIES: tetratricopeptide repeat protein [unclassified Pseudomonas]|uniref:tetratricopeptide repeat protein n=1 Tax=Pseudomonas TaxID=286 RepID=UPI00147BDC43|nr:MULTISPECIES: tetratricopeptide repeat protein [unclassified Pseudomonas]